MKRLVFALSQVLLVASSTNSMELMHYAFEQVDGVGPYTTPDSSPQGNTGTLSNMDNTNLVPGGIIGNALQFNGGSGGTANAVEVAEDDADFDRSYSQFTFAAWLKPTDATPGVNTDSWIAGKMGGGGNRGWQTSITPENHPSNPNQLLFGYFDAPGGSEQEVFSGPSAALADDTWVHWAVVFDAGNSIKLYINGTPVVTASSLGALNGSNNRPLQIGNRGTDLANSWDGLMDEVYIFDEALSDAQIAALVPEPSGFVLATMALTLAVCARRIR